MPKYTKELLEPIVHRSKSISDVIRELGLALKGGNYATIKRNLIKFNIDFSHFTGQGWSKGLTKETSKSLTQSAEKLTKLTVENALVKNKHLCTHSLRRLLSQTNLKYQCNECGLGDEWNGKPIVLHHDHINGDNSDNRIENLRYLCPNCHSQTKTYCGKNKMVRATGFEPALETF